MIIGISGKARSGKDTFSEMLAAEMNRQAYPPYVMMAFANELKLSCQSDFDLTWDQLWGDDKEVPDERYVQVIRTVLTGIEETPAKYWTAREIMQNYGAFYRSIDNDFWIKFLFKVAQEKDYTNVIITDVRYINEADYIINNGGYVIRIERDDKDEVHNMQHPSEIDLDYYKKFDFTILNDSTLEDLKVSAAKVAMFLKNNETSLKKIKEIKTNG